MNSMLLELKSGGKKGNEEGIEVGQAGLFSLKRIIWVGLTSLGYFGFLHRLAPALSRNPNFSIGPQPDP